VICTASSRQANRSGLTFIVGYQVNHRWIVCMKM
jgi:hypothetical protein